MPKLIIFSLILLNSFSSLAQKKHSDTICLFYAINERQLNNNNKARIDSAFYQGYLFSGLNLKIIGYADYLGHNTYNDTLSRDRAENVEVYLISFGFDRKNITYVAGKGAIAREDMKSPQGYPYDRRVDVVIDRQKKEVTKNINHGKILKDITKAKNIKFVLATKPIESENMHDILKCKPGQAFLLRNVYFEANSHDIRRSKVILDDLYEILDNNKGLKLQIEGHVCCISGYFDAYDEAAGDTSLSVNRAKAIYEFLVDKGISPERLKYIGYGRSRPLVNPEITEEDKGTNRRVELRIIENDQVK